MAGHDITLHITEPMIRWAIGIVAFIFGCVAGALYNDWKRDTFA